MRYLLIISFCFSFYMLNAQCNYITAIEEGKELVYELKNHKGKTLGYQAHQLEDRDGDTLFIRSTVYTKRKKKDFDFSYIAQCKDDTLFTDGVMVINGELLKGHSGIKIMSKKNFLEIPSALEPDMTLNDANFTIITGSKGFLSINASGFKVEITDRQVVGEETITTPAGTFDCIKIRHESEFGFLISFKVVNEVYYAPEIGTVKVMTYRKDALINSMELQEIK